ncbi:ShlB/FhaC/HecB family hemolysin secretion/activation protein [Crocosphaera chwakensis]|uniref:Surface antigen (D15) n=1 Tax=Crocosphaera chwakensis CCY0110 TaxID=391612 RepID=A3IYV0_9CHRO|nr:BamA/TamA family outer membrane protein [Crocosphaera chwakensis]EAZ88361.1 surface antigen (D15) [Crocosphaera chwakensis CCY0110]
MTIDTIPLLPSGVTLEEIILKDSSVITQEQVEEVAAPFLSKNVTLEDLRKIQTQLTELYTQAGYLNSLVRFLPQDNRRLEAGEGIIVYRAIESKLEKIEVQNLSHLHQKYVEDRLWAYESKPLNARSLEEGLLLLQQDELISKVEGKLIPGSSQGENIWIVRVEEAPVWQIATEISNEESPFVGEWGVKGILENKNIFGVGDRAQVEYKQTEGLERLLANISVPLNPQNGRLQLSYQFNKSEIIAEPFDPIDIRNESFTISASFFQPLIFTLTDKFSLGINVEHRESQSFVFNDFPFSFSSNVRDGFTELNVVRFHQTYQTRDEDDVFSVNSQINIGWSNLIDQSSFVSWQAQIQHLHVFSDRVSLLTRLSGQVGDNQLPTLEQCAIGGLNGNQFIFGNTVRGYATNVRSGDNCFATSVELWFNVIKQTGGSLSVVPFVDYATVEQNGDEQSISPSTLVSTGLGIRGQIGDISARLDYGIPLRRMSNSNLEEQRWNFSIFWGFSF